VIVTDRAITPPPGFRYVIWDEVPRYNATVVSAATLDPHYWRNPAAGRVMTIKNRLRSAALSITGRLLGLHACTNDECFMCGDVDSADALDFMTQLCIEHDRPKLESLTFARSATDPTLIQPVTPVVTTTMQRP
jgi:predicted Zn-dependent protease